ncbi:hypothetical protein V1J52_16650 [Streptomyces sp. TRM 70351]|uniref:hypothetical protein n=1 Tax=Streptomyces sp. TRM 70351 TaxID=3116552 RepID=UPI002E7BF7C4|nr:hypothetical protein [Streptomyces sp. TRM 70351]MEE1929796.1 hypothetical protein [Streptomyces sp. TRM 70351]
MTVLLGMGLLATGLAVVARWGSDGYGPVAAGLVVIGTGVALALPTMANALMSAVPRERAGVGAGVNGTLAEFGNSLGVAVLSSRFTALLLPAAVGAHSLPDALAAAPGAADRAAVADAFADGVRTGQYAGAAAVLAGGLLACLLLRRARRAPAPSAAPRPSRSGGRGRHRRPRTRRGRHRRR